MTIRPLRILTSLALLVPACYGDDQPADSDADVGADESTPDPEGDGADEPEVDPAAQVGGLDDEFREAAEEFGVPMQILQAVSYAETQWQMIAGEAEFDGQEPAYGIMALRGEHLGLGAGLIDASLDDVKNDRRTNIRAAAAVLRSYADDLEFDRDDLGAWAPAIASMSDIAVEDALVSYIHHDVYGAIQGGIAVRDLAGAPVAQLQPEASVVPDFTAPSDPTLAPGPDYAGSIWRASPNYSARPAGTAGQVKMVIIHTCEGNYSGCWGWLVNSQAGVSAHYVVKEDGSEISQLVRESNKAWHIGATYDCDLNAKKECGLEGYNCNNFTVGIEHAGFASQKTWNSNLINQSAKLTCDITKAHAVPRDKYHIVAHAQLQPYNRTDPGAAWPWTTYLNKVNEYCGAQPPAPNPIPSGEIVVDSNASNNDPAKAKITVSANWTSTAATPGFYGSGYWFANTAPVSDGAEFSFYLPAAATKTIDAWWTAGTNRSAAAPFVMFDSAGVKLGTVNANQQINGGKWVQLGTFNFKAGWNKVVVSRWAAEGYVVIADAIRVR
ncbi:N-acetylmuramoyl-L-alanine amidase [Nannocystis exedens]|uniref:N-acetylmuramoyl-L-alanine amidase n=1 Tax=Nannocystis exedens TaxID=54 RepID=A0A1I1UYE8_9BACT|nr:N-acetylmuramoyl-L-alanine amidase [Nannocystis exedens]PCC72191.1 N-acetylmuramoyl-L-alanine amidase [Nannocystis exedens]SFD75714.1 N-acetylmuramoyl-L-alanine amidase [Nannocystis exedens]